MKEACPSKWSQSGEMSSEDTAAAYLRPAKPYCCLFLRTQLTCPRARQEGWDVYIPNPSTPSSAREN